MVTSIKNNHSQILATFTEKDAKIYYPNSKIYESQRRRVKTINMFLVKCEKYFNFCKIRYSSSYGKTGNPHILIYNGEVIKEVLLPDSPVIIKLC